MFSVGETLKRARLERGLELSSVSARTKINSSLLEAIESDDRKKFPSGFFYRSFVDQYARALGLDTRELDAEIDRMLSGDAPLPLPGQDGNPIHRVAPLKVRDRFRIGRAFASITTLILVILACSAVYSWWHDGQLPLHFYVNIGFTPQPGRTPQVVEAAKPESAPPVAMPIRAVSPVPTPPIPPEAPTTNVPNVKLQLDITATEATWLSVTSDGKPVFSGILARNETKTVEGKQFAKIRIGNAAGLDVRLNGRPLGPLGGRGQVLDVVFTPDNFEIVMPGKEGD